MQYKDAVYTVIHSTYMKTWCVTKMLYILHVWKLDVWQKCYTFYMYENMMSDKKFRMADKCCFKCCFLHSAHLQGWNIFQEISLILHSLLQWANGTNTDKVFCSKTEHQHSQGLSPKLQTERTTPYWTNNCWPRQECKARHFMSIMANIDILCN